MEKDKGWIKLHRKILENEVFLYDDTAWKVFMVCLLSVNHETGSFTIGSRQLGRLVSREHTVAFRALKRLEKCKMVQLQTQRGFTKVSICKWADYQKDTQRVTQRQRNANATPTQPLQEREREVISNDITITLMKDFWKAHTGTSLRNHLEGNLSAYKFLEKDLEDRFPDYLNAVRMIRSDKYQPRKLQGKLLNYIGLKENLEQVEAYMQGKVDHEFISLIPEIS